MLFPKIIAASFASGVLGGLIRVDLEDRSQNAAPVEARRLIVVDDFVTVTVTKTVQEGFGDWPHHHHQSTSLSSTTTDLPAPTTLSSSPTQPTSTSTSTSSSSSIVLSSTSRSSTLTSALTSTSSTAVTSSTPATTSASGDALPTACSTALSGVENFPAVPTPVTQFNVDRYWGGDDFPFWVTQDVAPTFEDSSDDYVALHNQYRDLHGASTMVKNSTLEAQAQGYMNTGCPNGDPTSGSNWFATTGTGSFAAALGAWYSERSNYTANSDDFLCNSFDNSGTTSSGSTVSMQETGHFTQMVWNASTSVGCALSSTCSGSWTTQVLCLYYPVGNFGFTDNGVEWPETLYNVYRPSS